jgi:excinuclease ABC subunit A
MDRLVVRGAREHNLKDVHLDLPRDALIVFTGLSGSGKSSLAFDTIFAEGQRRYVESLSAYAASSSGRWTSPDVDFIEGLSPAVSIDQKSTNRNPRSTVGTITEVYDYLRCCTPAPVSRTARTAASRSRGRRRSRSSTRCWRWRRAPASRCSRPVVRARKGEYVDLFSSLQTQGFSRVRVDGVVHPLTEPPKLKKQEKHTIEVIVDRLTVKESAKRRLTDSVETALGLGRRASSSSTSSTSTSTTRTASAPSPSTSRASTTGCPFEALEPRSFSFNSPFGACPECTGIGTRKEVDPEPRHPRPGEEPGAGRGRAVGELDEQRVLPPAAHRPGQQLGFSMDTPWEKLPAKVQKAVLHGSPDQVHVRYKNRYGRERSYYAAFEGVLPFLERRHEDTDSDYMRDKYEGYMRDVPCPVCHGTRLKPEILAVKLNGRSIAEVTNLSIGDASEWLNSLELGERERAIADRVLSEIQARLSFLVDVGLGLPLARPAGGDARRR